jgi:predicted acetyltransferase
VSGLAFRSAREEDLERLVEIHSSAFPDPRSFDARAHNFTQNRLGALGDLQVALRGDTIVAHAFSFALTAGFGGARVACGGIASVGVAPEARGSGVASALLAHLHEASFARGDAITILFAFRQGFYARHGYAPATPTRRLVLAPSSIPPAWRAEGVRAARGEDRAAIASAYERALARSTGWLARDDRAWEPLVSDDRRVWLVVERAGAIAGYVAWSLEQSEAHAKTTMRVRELVADDDDARRALFGAIRAQRDQVTDVALDVAHDDPIDRALVDADAARFGTDAAEHVLGEVHGGPMVRVTDAARAIVARGYASDGDVRLVVGAGAEGQPKVGDAGAIGVRVRGGRASIADVTGPELSMDARTLSAILFGALAPSDAARLGFAHGETHALALADRLLALPPYFAIDPF